MNFVKMMNNYVSDETVHPIDLLLFDRIYFDGHTSNLSRYYDDLNAQNISDYLDGKITFEELIAPSPYLKIKLDERDMNMKFIKNRLEQWKEAEIPSLSPNQKQIVQIIIESDTFFLTNSESGNSINKYTAILLLLCTKWEASISYTNIEFDSLIAINFRFKNIFMEYTEEFDVNYVLPSSDIRKIASILEENISYLERYEKARKEKANLFLQTFLEKN